MKRIAGWAVGLVVGMASMGLARMAKAQEHAPSWVVRPLMLDANEGCAVGDVDGNGSPDIVAGRHWYPAPDFVPRPLRLIEDWNGYVQSNGDFLWDVNGDGRLDVIAGSFVSTEVHWYENPGPEGLRLGQLWPKHPLVDTGFTENEAQLLVDLDADNVPEWVVNSWNPRNPLVVWRLERATAPLPGNGRYRLVPAKLAETGNTHGLGVGDVNGDGRTDVLTGAGWYEHPAERPWDQTWTFHEDWQIQASIPMLVTDVDRDGRNDILVGEGHDYGLHFWRQMDPTADGKRVFDKQWIDQSFSQAHCLALADLNGDGRDELVTGKRYFAHNGGDPGGRDRPLLVAYSFDQASRTFQKSILEDGNVGTGLQIGIADLNGDRALDIVVPGKSGTYLLLNPGPASR